MIQIEGLQYIESIQKKLKRTDMTIDIVKRCNEYYLMISAIMIINSQQIKHYGDNSWIGIGKVSYTTGRNPYVSWPNM